MAASVLDPATHGRNSLVFRPVGIIHEASTGSKRSRQQAFRVCQVAVVYVLGVLGNYSCSMLKLSWPYELLSGFTR